MSTDRIESTFTTLLQQPQIQKALTYLRTDQKNKLNELKEMALISGAPHTELEIRSPMFLEKLRHYGLSQCTTDAIGNVFGRVEGKGKGYILVEGHLDTVFDLNTPLAITEDADGTLHCPGISDNTASLATELSIIRAIRECGLKPVTTLLIGGTVGEEAPGEARGVRYIMKHYPRPTAYLCLDSGQDFDIITGAVACKRHEIVLNGPGGHSWNNWGRTNPVNALGRAISLISDIVPVQLPKTTYNIGVIVGGTTVNTIASRAAMDIDIRSLDNESKLSLEKQILACLEQAVHEENRRYPDSEPITIFDRPYGDKPGGHIPDDSLIVQAAMASARMVDLPRTITEPASTNANFPISDGIPSLCINCNGPCGNLHAANEWYNPAISWKGAQSLLLLMFALSGLEGVTQPLL